MSFRERRNTPAHTRTLARPHQHTCVRALWLAHSCGLAVHACVLALAHASVTLVSLLTRAQMQARGHKFTQAHALGPASPPSHRLVSQRDLEPCTSLALASRWAASWLRPGCVLKALLPHLGSGCGKTQSPETTGCRPARGRPRVTSGTSQLTRAKGASGEPCEVGIHPGPGRLGPPPLAPSPRRRLQLLVSPRPWRWLCTAAPQDPCISAPSRAQTQGAAQ